MSFHNCFLFFRKIKNSNRKTTKRDKIDTPSTHIHEHSFSWLGLGTSTKCGGIQLVLYEKKYGKRSHIRRTCCCLECFTSHLILQAISLHRVIAYYPNY